MFLDLQWPSSRGRTRGSVCKPRVLTADSTLISWFKKKLEILLGDLRVASEDLL